MLHAPSPLRVPTPLLNGMISGGLCCCLCLFPLLPQALQALPPPLTVSEPDSVSAAVGVELNRLQNICITLDKAKHCLNQPGQCK